MLLITPKLRNKSCNVNNNCQNGKTDLSVKDNKINTIMHVAVINNDD
jgi:hypothetical protein